MEFAFEEDGMNPGFVPTNFTIRETTLASPVVPSWSGMYTCM